MLIDTHAHLYAEQFDQDREEMLQRAHENGVRKILLPNIDASSVDGMLELCALHPNICFPMMGLHPCSVQENYEDELEKIYTALYQKNIIAIGEIGIDLYWDKSTLPLQRLAFRKQVEWAKDLHLPIVIHGRDSYNELFEELNVLNDQNLSGVFHCFNGSIQQAEKILSYGNFYLGIGGVLTFKNTKLGDVLKELPLDKIILETDAPYLSPMPYRGQRNESAYVRYVAEKLAEITRKTITEIEEITTANAHKLFPGNTNQ